MGYSHAWLRAAVLDAALFRQASLDSRRLHEATRETVPLAGGLGVSEPEFSDERVWFNGVRDCGHPKRELGIPDPSPSARGIASPFETVEVGEWFGGAVLSRRACDGGCSHETFLVARVVPGGETARLAEGVGRSDGRLGECCKTAFKPYDLLVQACLIAFAHAFGPAFEVSSSTDERLWADARRLCRRVLGYGEAFRVASR